MSLSQKSNNNNSTIAHIKKGEIRTEDVRLDKSITNKLDKKEKTEKVTKNNEKNLNKVSDNNKTANNNNTFYIVVISILVVAVITLFIIIIIFNNKYNQLSKNYDEIENKLNIAEEESAEYLIKALEYKEKADFLNNNIVFVLEGYGNVYYTYDCVKKITGNEEYRYWAYNQEAAISKGFKKAKC